MYFGIVQRIATLSQGKRLLYCRSIVFTVSSNDWSTSMCQTIIWSNDGLMLRKKAKKLNLMEM